MERVSSRLFLRSYRPKQDDFIIYTYSRKLQQSIKRKDVDALRPLSEAERARLLIAMDRLEAKHQKRVDAEEAAVAKAQEAQENRRIRGLSRALKGLTGAEREKVMSKMNVTEADVRLLEANNPS